MSNNQALGRSRDFTKAKSKEACRNREEGVGMSSKKVKILFANIAGVPIDPNSKKNDDIERWINKSDADVIGLAETNICWYKASHGPFHERAKKWMTGSPSHLRTNIHTSTAHNELEENPSEYQIGGTAIITRGSMSCRISSKGSDTTKLGRWAWTDYRGVRDIKLRIICAYRLVNTSNRGGTETVHAQHLRALHKLGRQEEPIKAFDKDFFSFIQQSQHEGYQLIIMMDANENLQRSNFANRIRSAGMVDHLSHDWKNRNINSFYRGTSIIDGVFCSPNVVITEGKFHAFAESPGDHRGIELEIRSTSVLGVKNPTLQTLQPRRLQCKLPTSVRNYNEALQQYLRNHNLDKKAAALRQNAEVPLTPPQQQEYERLDGLMVIGMKAAEKRCRKLHMGATQWVPQVTDTYNKIHAIDLMLRKNKGAKIGTTLIKRILKKANMEVSLINASSQELRQLEANAHMERRQHKKNHVTHREEWLTCQESKMFDRGKSVIASKLKAKKNREEMRRTSSRIKAAIKPFQSRGVTKIIVDGLEVTDHEGIVAGFKREAIKRGRQTENTPFMTEPLIGEFGHKATNDNADKVLKGDYIPKEGTDPYVVKLLPHLVTPESISREGNLKSAISTIEYVNAWRNKNEYTGSGPSGLHYGHFKAMCWNNVTADFHTNMANIPLLSGYSPTRWRLADDHMEQKRPDNFNVDRFRPIIHVEADFNMANGFIGRRIMNNAEKHKVLAAEQYGSRKEHSAHDQALNKRLLYDITRQLKKPMILIANDAKSCYDRILHIMVMLCARRLGLDLEPILSMINTIQLMAHQIHTAYGASLGYGPDDWEQPFQGILQGNQFGPPSWAIISSPMFDMLRFEGYGMRLCSPLSGKKLHLAGTAFVDDTDTCQNGMKPDDTSTDILQHAQGMINHWEGAIRASGGALDPKKTHWYLIDFTWKNGDWGYAEMNPENKLDMLDSEGKRIQIQQLPTSKGMKTLGVILAPDGNNNDVVEAMTKKAEVWANLIYTGHLQREEVWRALNSTIIKSLEYPLTATTLTAEETQSIFAPIRQAALPKSGIVRTFPRDIVHAPTQYQGLGIPCLFATQQIKHIMTILKFGGTNTTTGALIRTSLELLKLEVGISRQMQDIAINHVAELATDSWIKQTWLHAEMWGLHITDEPQFLLRREGDAYLMELILRHQPPAEILVSINKCRIYHKILTLSDVLTGDGNRLRADIWTNAQSIDHDDRSDWPSQGKPSNKDWQRWEHCLLQLFDIRARNGYIHPSLQLGEGKVTESWKWFYWQESIYQVEEGRTKEFSQLTRRRSRRKRYQFSRLVTNLPPQAQPCTIEQDGSKLVMTGTIQPEEEQINHPRSLQEHINNTLQKCDWYKWVFEHTPVPSLIQLRQLKEAIEDGTLIGCTDASVKKGISAASFQFQTKEGFIVLQGEVVIPGTKAIQNSHRGEMGGAAAALKYLQVIIEFLKIKKGSVKLACDSDSVVYVGLTQTSLTNSIADHYDLIRICRDIRTQLKPIQLSAEQVQGHTDNKRKHTVLEKMNIACDRRAGEMRRKVQKDNIPIPQSTLGYWQLWYEDVPILTNLEEKIREIIHDPEVYHYWTRKAEFRIDDNSYDKIDWQSLGKAMRGSSLYKRHFVAKHTTGHCGVGKMMRRWGFRKDGRCPRCKAPEETSLHVLECKAKSAVDEWETQIGHLENWLNSQRTNKDISNAIIYNLQKWRKAGNIFPHHYQDETIRAAIKEQKDIGWENFMVGRLSTKWGEAQDKYYKSIASRKTGMRWVQNLIKIIWEVHWSVWDQRNRVLFDTGNHIVLGSQKMERDIRRELQDGWDLVLPTERYLFNIKMEDVKKWTATKKEKWLQTVHAARQASRIRHQATTRSRQFLRQWLEGTTECN